MKWTGYSIVLLQAKNPQLPDLAEHTIDTIIKSFNLNPHKELVTMALRAFMAFQVFHSEVSIPDYTIRLKILKGNACTFLPDTHKTRIFQCMFDHK